MKAAVIESNNGKSIVLTEDGIFHEIDGSFEPGRIIDFDKWMTPAVPRKKVFRNIAAAACLVLALLIGGFSVTNPAVYASVELGEGYSVRYLLDENLNVLDIEATEESGSELASDLESHGVKGRNISEAITMAEDLTGHKYNALSDPPDVRCKDKSAGEDITNSIYEHHSVPDNTGDSHDEPAPSKVTDAEDGQQRTENKPADTAARPVNDGEIH